ncbi:hypothetical protein [Nonomuraea sp. B5E05]|uniref:hypothetical protein n=1 Tax=Nonomuraea sp. B5E05 TaxID=3153569 RepID=UPI00326188D0
MASGGYPVVALVCRVRRSAAPESPLVAARVVSGAGLAAVAGAFCYLSYLIMTGGKLAVPGPVVGGRPVIWLALQALAVATVAGTLIVAVRRRRVTARGERVRLGVLVTGGAVFLPWALYWDLALP